MAVDAFAFEGKRYGRDSFPELLRQRMKEMRDDPKSPYRDAKHPQHAAAVADMRNGYRWLNGEMSEAEEHEIASAVNEALRGEPEMATTEIAQRPELQATRGMNEIAQSREGREALQRARTGQELTPAQAKLVQQYKELEQQHNSQAKPVYTGGTFKVGRPHYVSPELYRIEAIKDPRERAHAIRAEKSRLRDDPKSPFSDTSHPDHKSAVNWMDRLYRAEAELPQPEDENG
jgi:hypothetical protein